MFGPINGDIVLSAVTIFSITGLASPFLDDAIVESHADPKYVKWRTLTEKGDHPRFNLRDGLLWTTDNPLVVSRAGRLCQIVLDAAHDYPAAGHQGITRTLDHLGQSFCWPTMAKDTRLYIRSCLVCQQDKTECMNPAGLLQPC